MNNDTKTSSFAKQMIINQLHYGVPDDITLVDSRSLKRYYSQRTSYSAGDSMIFELGTGTDYIHGLNSYLTFNVQSLDVGGVNPEASFGGSNSTALNLINSGTLVNGEELDRQDAINTLAVSQMGYENGIHVHESLGQLMGGAGHGATPTLSTATRVVIPLSKVMSFFATDKLIPSQIISGARLTLKLEDAVIALVYDAAPTGTANYTITDPSIMLDSFNLTDDARSFLVKKASSKDGLPFSWKAYEHTNVSIASNVNRKSAGVGKPVSDALSCIVKVRPMAYAANTDSFVSQAYDESTRTRFKLGSMQFPDQKIENSAEQYAMSLRAFDKLRDSTTMPHVSYEIFKSSYGIIGMSFERHHILKLSGLPLNQGGRSMTLDWEVDTNPTAVQLDAHMGYVKVASGFADGSIVVKH